MELNITHFFNEACPMDYSASVAEIGQTAGEDTWRTAIDDSEHYMILNTNNKREAFENHLKGFGAWPREEIQSWSNLEINALLLQMISSDIREFQELANSDWDEWQKLNEAGTCCGRLYGCPLSFDGQVYYSIDD